MIFRIKHIGTGIGRLARLLLALIILTGLTVSCSDSDNKVNGQSTIVDDEPGDPSQEEPVFQVYSETGRSGMQVTYSPSSLSAMTNVEELEEVYTELMACVGITSATPPALLLTNDDSQFYVREDGADVWGFYNIDIDSVNVYFEDVTLQQDNRFWWTRHGMIKYLIDVHGLNPDSDVSPFLACHWSDS